MFTSISVQKSLMVLLILITSVMCTTQESEINEEDKNLTALEGKWYITTGQAYGKKENGEIITIADIKPNTFSHEILSKGKYIGHDYVMNKKVNGVWKLEDIKESSVELNGVLAFSTPDTEALKGELSVDSDGFQRFQMTIQIKTTPNHMVLKSKEYEAFPYKSSWVQYFFERK